MTGALANRTIVVTGAGDGVGRDGRNVHDDVDVACLGRRVEGLVHGRAECTEVIAEADAIAGDHHHPSVEHRRIVTTES